MLDPVGLAAELVQAGAVPLPGRVEIRDLHEATQIAGAVRVAARTAPVVLPERRAVVLAVVVFGGGELPEPVRLPAAVVTLEEQVIAADQSQQVTEQGRRHPVGGGLAAVIADDPRQGAQVPSAGCYRALHHASLPHPGYSGRGRQDIRRTSDSGHGRTWTPWLVSGPRPRPDQVGDMDEIGQDPKLNVRLPRGRLLDVAVAVAPIAP